MTIVSDLLQRCEALGARLRADGEHIDIEAPAPLPPDLVEQLRQQKSAILDYLRMRGYHVKNPERSLEAEGRDIAAIVKRDRYVLLWCEAVKDLVAFHRDDVDPATIPPGFVPYSEAELWELFGKPGMTQERLQLIHEAKKQGARVIARDNDDGHQH